MPHELKRILIGFARLHPARQATLGYAAYILAGWLLLCLPFAHASEKGTWLDNLFTASSAVSTTGLATIDTGTDYSFFGQAVILVLMQLGGVGYMTAGSFAVLARKRRLPEFREGVGNVVFSLPEGFSMGSLVRGAVYFTLAIELVGALLLFFAFRDAGSQRPLWDGVFHSVSAFCTAGFALDQASIEPFRSHVGVNATLSALAILGSIGFIAMTDVWSNFTRRRPGVTLTTKIILIGTSLILLVSTLLLFVHEPNIRELPPHQRLMAAFFQAMSASTTVGFSSVPTASLTNASSVLLILLMIIGASPSGTGGGLKITTITAVIGVVKSALNGQQGVQFLRRTLPEERVRSATANVAAYLLTLMGGVYMLTLTERHALGDLAFEATSALGTVGLSRGITPSLTPIGKVITMGLMFFGRVGPMVMALSLIAHEPEPPPKEEDVAV